MAGSFSRRCARKNAVAFWRSTLSESVFNPRSVSQQSNGEGTAPVAFCRNFTGARTAGSRASTAPWIRSECPARYFVTEWTTRSAPSSNGLWFTGDANVLSTTASAPNRCAASHAAAMSTTWSRGLVGDSSQRMRAPSSAESRASASPTSTCTLETPSGWNTCLRSRNVPP